MLFISSMIGHVIYISYVGCTTDALKTRFSNHKSHIKLLRPTCELSKHFIENPSMHNLDKSSNKAYDISLKSHISIVGVEHVDVSSVGDSTYDRLQLCEQRESFWKDKLRTMNAYGGLNAR